jgi:uncharacterized membrane protein YfcA
MFLIIVLVLVGLFAGTMSGLLGIGGGTVFTPVLFYLFDRAGVQNPELWTIGTSLFCTFSATAGGTLKQIQQNSAFLRESAFVGIVGIVGTTIGKLVATSEWFSRDEFLVLIGVVLLYTGLNFLRNSYKTRKEIKEVGIERMMEPAHIATTGTAGGFLAAISGLGGGIIMVPVMNLWFKYTLKKTVSVAQFAIVIISVAGFTQYMMRSPGRDLINDGLSTAGAMATTWVTLSPYTVGYLDFGVSLPMVLGSFVGGAFGVWLHTRINTSLIKLIFGILVVIASVRMFAELWM